MQYVHVLAGFNEKTRDKDTQEATLRQAGSVLFSLAGGMKQKNFGLDTMIPLIDRIRNLKNNYISKLDNGRIFVDSGGYSIIVGDIHPDDTRKAIGCYHYYLKEESNIYDAIFSLDIPTSPKYPEFNTKENIYNYNKISLTESSKVLTSSQNITKKFFFVWQFKMIDQYQIWNKLYDELKLNNVIKNRAIGGMVSLRDPENGVNIDFSPFTAMSYRCLFDYINAGDFRTDFRLHMLGINIAYDRFQIALLEKLFKRYLEEYDCKNVLLTYDSFNYTKKVYLAGKDLGVFSFDGKDIVYYPHPRKVPDLVLRGVYLTDQMFNKIKQEQFNIEEFKYFDDINSFVPLSVYSNMCLDRFFEHIIDKYEIVDKIFKYSDNVIPLKNEIEDILQELQLEHSKLSKQYKSLFTDSMIKSIKSNIRWTLKFHKWYTGSRTYESLNDLIYQFINEINFPHSLA